MAKSSKKKFKLVFILFILFFVFNLQGVSAKTKDNKKVSISYTAGEVMYVINIMERVALKGDEVNAFVEVSNIFVDKAKEIQKKKMKTNDIVKISISFANLRNFMTFIQRANLKGAEAFQFHSVTSKAINAAK